MDGARIAILALLACALLSTVFYFMARPAAPARVDRPGIIPMLGRWAYWLSRPVVRAAASLGVTPNAMTALGLALTVMAAVAAGFGAFGWAAFLLVLGAWCDLIDGELARTTGMQSPGGAFLDSSVDRLSEIALFSGIAFGSSRGTAEWAVAALVASLMVSYSRARGEGLGVGCPAFGMERPHRLVVIIFSLVAAGFLPFTWSDRLIEATLALLAATAAGTALFRMVVVYHLLEKKHATLDVHVDEQAGSQAPAARGR